MFASSSRDNETKLAIQSSGQTVKEQSFARSCFRASNVPAHYFAFWIYLADRLKSFHYSRKQERQFETRRGVKRAIYTS